MITPAYARTMAAYNAELNRRIYAAAARLPDEERQRDRSAFWRSIHGTLSHLVWADRMWMSRLAGWPKPDGDLAHSDRLFDAFEAMAAARATADSGLEAWAAGLDEPALADALTWYSGAADRTMTAPRALIVVHLFNHQTHHRGQVHAMLTAAGERTGDTDLPLALPLEL